MKDKMSWVEIISKYLPIWVAVSISFALIVGCYFPEKVSIFKPFIPLYLFIMLYPMMINLRIEDIIKVARKPKPIFLAIFMNFLISPLLAFLWTHLLFQSTPYLAAGFILKIVVPCSGMVAAWTGYARGRVETALIIVALSLILAIFFIPFWMWILARIYIQIDPFMIFQKLILIVILPLIAGIATRKLLIHKVGMEGYRQIAQRFPAISTCGMLIMVFIIISTQASLIVPNFHYVLLVVFGIAILYPLNSLLVVLLSKILRFDYGDAIALVYSVTAKNHAITIGIAVTAFGALVALPAAVAPLIQIPIMLLILRLSSRLKSLYETV